MIKILREIPKVFTQPSLYNLQSVNLTQRICGFHTTIWRNCENKNEDDPQVGEASKAIDPSKDRRKAIPVETSIRYLQSPAYKQTYGDQFVWEQYRRNHKGLFPPRKTRKTCIRAGVIATGNPCPICRDEYLVLDHRNIDLLRQFISPHTGQVLSYSKTGLCQKSHLNLLVAVERAYDYGLLTFNVPFREYDYSEYYSKEELEKAGIILKN